MMAYIDLQKVSQLQAAAFVLNLYPEKAKSINSKKENDDKADTLATYFRKWKKKNKKAD